MYDVYENTVRFEETDAQGIVFYGNYTIYQDETFTEFMDAIGYPYSEIKMRGWDVHVVNVDLSFRKPATFRDHLTNAMCVASINHSSIEFVYECRNEDDEVLVEGSVVHVAVDESGEPIRVPEEFRRAVAEFQDVPPDQI